MDDDQEQLVVQPSPDSRLQRNIFKGTLAVVIVGLTVAVAVVVYVTYVSHIDHATHDTACLGSNFTKIDNQCFQHDKVPIEGRQYNQSLDDCKKLCIKWSCYSLDFYTSDGECLVFVVSGKQRPLLNDTLREPDEMKDKAARDKELSCDHYDRVCA